MKYKKLGKSDLSLSIVGFGCMSLPESEAESTKLLTKAFDLGINYFDTADLYEKGYNEEKLGKAFKDRRDQVIIGTKVGNQWRKDGTGWDWNPTRDYIIKAVEESLRRLQTEYIDLYQLHGGTMEDPIDEILEAFELLKKAGKIRYFGISSIRPNVIRNYLNRSNIKSVMLQYSLLDRRPEEECLNLLENSGVGVIVRGALAKGLLINKASKAYLEHDAEKVGKVKTLVQALTNSQRSAAQVALHFTLAHPAVTSVVAGVSNPHQLIENVEVLKAPPLNDQELARLRAQTPVTYYQNHR